MHTVEQAKELVKQASELQTAGKYNDAIALLEQATPVFEAAEDWEGYVASLNNYAHCLRFNGKYDEGIEKAEKALQICLDKWGEQNRYTGDTYYRLAVCYQYAGHYKKAIDFQWKSLNIQLKTLGEKHLNIADSYNNLGNCYFRVGDYIQAIDSHEKALTVRLAVVGEQHPHTAMSYSGISYGYYFKGDYDLAIAYVKRAIDINLAIYSEGHSEIASNYNNLGGCYERKGDYIQAIACCQKALAIWLAVLPRQHPNVATTYDLLGICFRGKGDYSMSELFGFKALSIRLTTLKDKHHIEIGHSYANLGNVYIDKGNYSQAIDYLKKALAIFLKVSDIHALSGNFYTNLGVCYQLQGDYRQAIDCYQKSVNIWSKMFDKTHPSTGVSYNNLGLCYVNTNDYTQAIVYYQQALAIKEILGKEHPATAQTFRNLANYHHLLINYPQALHHYQLALQSLALNVPDKDYYPLPKLEGYNSAVELLEVLPAKATTLAALYHQSQNPQDLTAALAYYQCADALIGQMRQSYKTEGSKLLLAEKGKTKVYDAGLAALFDYQLLVNNTPNNMLTLSHFNQILGYQLPDRPIDLAFHFSEKSKAVLLFAGMKDAEARLNAQLPPDLVQQEYDLRIELTYLERRISEEGYKKDEEQDKTALSEWQSQHFDFKNQYDALIERLETEYPKYYQLKYDLQAANIAQVQTALPPNKAMISYVLADKYVYTIIITAQQSYWLQTDLPTDFEGLVEDFLLSFQPKIGIRDYITYSYDLYCHLILPALNTGALHNIQHLIIIPDGILSRVPFEALLTAHCTDKTPLQDLPYLLQQYQIAYHYSATLWLNQQTAAPTQEPENANENAPHSGRVVGGQDFIGFAPIYSNTAQNSSEHDIDLTLPDDFWEKVGIEKPEEKHRINYTETAEAVRSVVEGRNFVELTHSETEVRNVAELFAAQQQTAKLLLHEKATLDNFRALVGKYRYILVSAHADYNGEKPDQTGIIFSPNETDGNGIFYMGDAYNLQLQADLVVLSCCETGLGKISKGEGTMALNRGFLYSGAKNVVYTLFKVYDKESCELSTELFRQLIAQKPNAEALHQSKLNLIARGLMPIKWAGYVLVGQ
jgi:tetratricopeptide (TPR) repeat protein/CHAT domain-containing protein